MFEDNITTTFDDSPDDDRNTILKKLLRAARDNDFDKILDLRNNCEISDNDALLMAALKIACAHGHLSIAQWIVKHSSICEAQDLNEALKESCTNGHLHIVKWLVENFSVDVNYKVAPAPLITASNRDHLHIVEYLLTIPSINVNLVDNTGHTPLLAACLKGNVSILTRLLQVDKIDVNIVGRWKGFTALHYVIWHSKNSQTALHKACSHNGYLKEVVRLSYTDEGDMNSQDNDGNTPLILACISGREDIIEY